ncbi:MAG: hypothetical protein WCH20_16570, partial [Nitrospira sp.]
SRTAGQRERETCARVVRDGAVHKEATVGANREEHGSLAGRASVEGEGLYRKAGRGGNLY